MCLFVCLSQKERHNFQEHVELEHTIHHSDRDFSARNTCDSPAFTSLKGSNQYQVYHLVEAERTEREVVIGIHANYLLQ